MWKKVFKAERDLAFKDFEFDFNNEDEENENEHLDSQIEKANEKQ